MTLAGVDTSPSEVPHGASDDLHRAAGTMVLVRWLAAPWVLLQIVAYEVPYPPGYRALAFFCLGGLLLGNLALMVAHRSSHGRERARSIALVGLALDVAILSAFVWLYAFDYQTQIWAVLLIAPLEGAILFQLVGALSAWGVIVVAYSFREIWAASRYDNPLLWNSISFRMGVGGIIALVAGMMARNLLRQRTQVAAALAEIQRIDAMRAGLVSMLGHDIRSPLTVIRGVIGTLVSSDERVSPEDRQKLLEAADRQARRLESLANDLLDLARLDEGRLDLEIERVAVEDLLRESLTYVEGGEQITIECENDLLVRADPRRFEQVIINLASNALHHGAMPITITARQEEDHAVIDVTDHGPGVPEKELGGLFTPFNSERKSGSIGYGLAIVKALVEAQEGHVDYVSNGGTTFRVTLPKG